MCVGGGWEGLAVLVPRPGDGRPVVPLIVSPIDLGGQRSGRGRREGRGAAWRREGIAHQM